MPTPLSLYLTSTDDTGVLSSTGRQLSNSPPASESSHTEIATSPTMTGWGEAISRTGIYFWPGNASIGSPDGKGWIWDVTTLEGQTISGGTWTAALKLATAGGSIVADINIRAFVRTSFGVYNQIGILTLTSQTITTTPFVYSLAATFAQQAFNTGDKIYIDVWLNVRSATGWSGLVVYENGGANEVVSTPGYTATGATTLSLPFPYIDHNDTKTVAVAAGVQVNYQTTVGTIFTANGTENAVAYVSGLSQWLPVCFLTATVSSGTQFQLSIANGPPHNDATIIETIPYSSAPEVWSQVYTVEGTIGPLRLGRGMITRTDIGTPHPEFTQIYDEDHWVWFADNQTVVTWTVMNSLGAVVWSSSKWFITGLDTATNPAPSASVGGSAPCPVGVNWQSGHGNYTDGYNPGGVEVGAPGSPTLGGRIALFSGVALDGNSVTWPLSGMGLSGGSGSLNSRSFIRYFPPFEFTYDTSVKSNGGPESGAPVYDSVVSGLPPGAFAPVTALPTGVKAYSLPNYHNWPQPDTGGQLANGGPVEFWISQDWAVAQSPPLAPDPATAPGGYTSWIDRHIPIYAVPGLSPPDHSGSVNYNPVTLRFAGRIEVNRPDGNTPSTWTGGSGCAVTEQTTQTLFTCATSGGTAIRNLSYTVDFSNFKHAAGEDVYWWASYGYMEMVMVAPEDGIITLAVSYSSHHADGTNTPGTATYEVSLSTGDNTVAIDLLFPVEGGPAQLGRVNQLQLSGLGAGQYTLLSLALVAKGNLHFKAGFGFPRTRTIPPSVPDSDFSYPVASNGGSFVYANIGDQANKEDEIGTYGGSPRYVDLFTAAITDSKGFTTLHVQDEEKSLIEAWNELNRIEGFTCIYDVNQYNDNFIDALGESFGQEVAQWLWNILPYQDITPDTDYKPPCSPTCGRMYITSGMSYYIRAQGHLGGGIEAVVSSGGVRQANTLTTLYDQSGAVAAQATTDDYGWVVFTPLAANEAWWYAFINADGTKPTSGLSLRPRDLPRIPAVINPPEPPPPINPFNVQDELGSLHRVAVRLGAVRYWFSEWVLPPWEHSGIPVVIDSHAIHPRIAIERAPWSTIHVVYQTGTTPDFSIYETTSTDEGATWTTPAFLAAGEFPTIASGEEGQMVRGYWTGGSIFLSEQYPGEAVGFQEITSAIGVPLAFAEDTFHLAESRFPDGRWLLHANRGTTTQVYYSTDMLTWEPFDTGWSIAGGVFPTIAVGQLGEIVAAALVGSSIHILAGYPGEAPVSFVMSSGGALNLANDTFHISPAYDPAARWVASVVVSGENAVSEWSSTDEGATCSRAAQV